MATATKKCKVCGVEYPYCKTEYKPGVFRYQDVACCPEHGSEYLAQVEAARAKPTTNNDAKITSQEDDYLEVVRALIMAEVIGDDEEDDEEDEDYFEDEEE